MNEAVKGAEFVKDIFYNEIIAFFTNPKVIIGFIITLIIAFVICKFIRR